MTMYTYIPILHVMVSAIQSGQAFSHCPPTAHPTHLDAMGEKKIPTQPLKAVGKTIKA